MTVGEGALSFTSDGLAELGCLGTRFSPPYFEGDGLALGLLLGDLEELLNGVGLLLGIFEGDGVLLLVGDTEGDGDGVGLDVEVGDGLDDGNN